MEKLLVRYGLRFLTQKTIDTKFDQKVSLKNGRVRYGLLKNSGILLHSNTIGIEKIYGIKRFLITKVFIELNLLCNACVI